MFTRDERRALVFLALVAAAGGLMRVVRSEAGAPPGAAVFVPATYTNGPRPGGVSAPAAGELAAQLARVERAESLARPLAPGDRIDADRAVAAELERLPGVGPALAGRIAANRDSLGPFGSLEGLDRVPGIGPAMLRKLAPWVRFSGVARVTEVQARKRVAPVRRAP